MSGHKTAQQAFVMGLLCFNIFVIKSGMIPNNGKNQLTCENII